MSLQLLSLATLFGGDASLFTWVTSSGMSSAIASETLLPYKKVVLRPALLILLRSLAFSSVLWGFGSILPSVVRLL